MVVLASVALAASVLVTAWAMPGLHAASLILQSPDTGKACMKTCKSTTCSIEDTHGQ